MVIMKKKEKKPIGRPSLMTPETVAKLERAFANGYTDEQACISADISKNTLYDYIERNPEFGNRKEMLKKRVDIQAKNKLVESIRSGDMQSVKFWLERKCKDEFSTRVEQSGINGKELLPANINVQYVNPVNTND